MGSKTLTITEEAYDRLTAEKREDESYTETITRILATTHSDWRRGFGRYAGADGEDFERVVADSKRGVSEGVGRSTDRVLESMGFELDEAGNVLASPDDTNPNTDESS
jgi:predicted CopG family antitoxin